MEREGHMIVLRRSLRLATGAVLVAVLLAAGHDGHKHGAGGEPQGPSQHDHVALPFHPWWSLVGPGSAARGSALRHRWATLTHAAVPVSQCGHDLPGRPRGGSSRRPAARRPEWPAVEYGTRPPGHGRSWR